MSLRLLNVVVAATALFFWLSATPALAAPSEHGGRVLLSLPGGSRGPLVLSPGQGGWVGELTVTNLGAESLSVSRVAIRGDEDDVRAPKYVAVRFADGAATTATLLPGGSRDIVVSWMPEKDPRVGTTVAGTFW